MEIIKRVLQTIFPYISLNIHHIKGQFIFHEICIWKKENK